MRIIVLHIKFCRNVRNAPRYEVIWGAEDRYPRLFHVWIHFSGASHLKCDSHDRFSSYDCAEDRIRTYVAVKQQIYSLPSLTAWVPQHLFNCKLFGANVGNRTRDLILTKNALYQLSYVGDYFANIIYQLSLPTGTPDYFVSGCMSLVLQTRSVATSARQPLYYTCPGHLMR